MACVVQASAASGDTTIIIAHTLSNLASPPSDDDAWVVFPNNGTTCQRIIMKFTLGCGIPNCSGWDYTVNASLGKKDGTIDSSVVSIDTLTQDTTWNYFDHVEFIEVGRLITPYGTYMANNSNGFNSSWTHPYYYDVTDYAGLLKDSVNVRVHYDGWTDAFSARVEFLMVEGTPARTVSSVEQIYNTYIGYPDKAGFENVAVPKSVFISPDVSSAKVAVTMTGHGSQGEFDPHSFHLKVNGSNVRSQLLWKSDCGMNAIAPQGGTWIFNRANWCPGEKVPVYEMDITPYINPGTFATIDLDFDDYMVQAGEGAGYGTSVHLITYSSQNSHDVMLEEIIAPNTDKSHLHYNPVCTNPIVKIKNMGNVPLTYAEISYWVKGGSKWYYEWTGNLSPLESEIVTLPAFDWNSDSPGNTTFIAETNWPNDTPDEYIYNNHLESQFTPTPIMDSVFVIQIRTNDRPEENWYVLKNEDGATVLFRNNFAAVTTHRDTLQLLPGSYALDVYDYDSSWGGGDGLSWWLNVQNGWEAGGTFSLRRSNNSVIKTFNGDFGSNIHYEFTVGYELGQNPPKTAPEPPLHTGVHDVPRSARMNVFPNPAGDFINIKMESGKEADAKILLTDISGKILLQDKFSHLNKSLIISTSALSNGMYFVSYVSESARIVRKLVIQR